MRRRKRKTRKLIKHISMFFLIIVTGLFVIAGGCNLIGLMTNMWFYMIIFGSMVTMGSITKYYYG